LTFLCLEKRRTRLIRCSPLHGYRGPHPTMRRKNYAKSVLS
jgi:hypothetical protein